MGRERSRAGGRYVLQDVDLSGVTLGAGSTYLGFGVSGGLLSPKFEVTAQSA